MTHDTSERELDRDDLRRSSQHSRRLSNKARSQRQRRLSLGWMLGASQLGGYIYPLARSRFAPFSPTLIEIKKLAKRGCFRYRAGDLRRTRHRPKSLPGFAFVVQEASCSLSLSLWCELVTRHLALYSRCSWNITDKWHRELPFRSFFLTSSATISLSHHLMCLQLSREKLL